MNTRKFMFAVLFLFALFAVVSPIQAANESVFESEEEEEIIIVEDEPMGSSIAITNQNTQLSINATATRVLEVCLLRSDSRSFDLGHSTACCSDKVGTCLVCEKGETGVCRAATFGNGSSAGPTTPAGIDGISDGTSNTILSLADPLIDLFTRDEVFDPGTTIVVPNNVRPMLNACLAASDRRVRLSVPFNSRVQCCSSGLNYCMQCRQDGRGVCIQSPYARNWSAQADGFVPQSVRRTNNSSSSSGGGSGGGGPTIID